jgi:glycosyltransferase involved in cell wall biosynthesis
MLSGGAQRRRKFRTVPWLDRAVHTPPRQIAALVDLCPAVPYNRAKRSGRRFHLQFLRRQAARHDEGQRVSRVAVVTSSPPFGEGGHLVIARALVSALRCAGHEADAVITPSHRFGRQASAYLATWLTDVSLDQERRPVDRVISLRYPSYAVRHPAHVCWLNHRMREYYDLWPSFSATLRGRARMKERVRRATIHRVDRYLLTRNVRRVVAQSKTIQERLLRFGGVPADVLHPPAPPRQYRCEGYGDYLFAVSRLTPLKRLDLLVEALALPEARGIRCVIAGEGEDAGRLTRLVRDRGLDSRVMLIGAVDSDQLLDHLARCRAVCFPPRDEDYGLVTIEAFSAGKAVITCTDSGGPTELVEVGVTGLMSEPRPERLAVAIARVMDDRGLAERLGAAALRKAATMTWAAAVDNLLAPGA